MKTLIQDRQGRFSLLKATTLGALLAPAIYLSYRAGTGDLGPLKYVEAIHVTGDWAIRFLIATLALTPAMRIFNWPKLALIRRMAGVGAFAYMALHFLLYVVNSKFNAGFIASEIALRLYLTIGFAALIGFGALAATSTEAMVRRLGTKWKVLHKSTYWLSVIALVHAFMQYKLDATPAVLLAGFYILFMSIRVLIHRRIALSPLVIAGAAVMASATTAAVEFAWYQLATGVNAWKILLANLSIQHGLRPAVIVLGSGLVVALIVLAKNYKIVPFRLEHLRPVR